MAKVRKIGSARIKKISGGKDPIKLVEEFMVRRGFDPEECLQQRTSQITTWSVPLDEEEELEITVEGLSRPAECTLYMGVNVLAVPIKDAHNVIAAALIASDTLIAAKLSLVNHDIVLSITVYTANMGVDEVDYYYELITRQKSSILEAIQEEYSS